MAPPVLVDITEDGIYDIIVNAYDGRMIAIDGADNSIIWQIEMQRTEVYPSLAVGQFTEDSIPDFFTNYGMGTWPNLRRSVQIMVNGRNGEVESMDTLGTFQFSTPVVADFNHDDYDDALLGVNNFK